MKTGLSDDELRAWQAFLHAHQRVIQTLDRDLRAKHGISLDAYDILVRLARAEDGRLRMTELARRVMVPPSTLTRKVDRLAAAGLVARHRVEHDARAMIVALTPEGRGLTRRAAITHLRGIRQEFVEKLGETHLRNVADALEAISGPHVPH
jgi:DNA-binding MarR family transcriptional regulator